MTKLNPNAIYPGLNLKWEREDYIHSITFHITIGGYLITNLYHKGIKLANPPFLYRYFAPNENSLKGLKNSYLYFSDPKGFGDEYDCLISDDGYVKSIIDNSINLNENLGVCCFCTVPDEDQMWDYYASGFKGFALKYKNDAAFLPYGKKASIKSHIIYLENNGPNNPNLIETLKSIEGKHSPEMVKNWQNDVLFFHELCRKRLKYAFEKEYRIISFFANEFERRIPIRKSNVDSIYVGNKMPKEYLEKLITVLSENPKIKIFIIRHDYKQQAIKFERMKNIRALKNSFK
ncbi:DUF2971 domain-containing protein [Flavobacterium macacae]|uniref:DUF2971 domain-containing protein n=1 Tax=Flavobacterium macacae TaxID=2488993 RepID=A0A3P3WBG3_9FLAO|nr:DUF2971 domain-containing protein [Flavobacterium macacae]RRJ91356.1 DUF2971 domain-containing protein [Flavobacterium macacae]